MKENKKVAIISTTINVTIVMLVMFASALIYMNLHKGYKEYEEKLITEDKLKEILEGDDWKGILFSVRKDDFSNLGFAIEVNEKGILLYDYDSRAEKEFRNIKQVEEYLEAEYNISELLKGVKRDYLRDEFDIKDDSVENKANEYKDDTYEGSFRYKGRVDGFKYNVEDFDEFPEVEKKEEYLIVNGDEEVNIFVFK